MTDDSAFDEPKRIAINRVYTGKGDAGQTSLVGGQSVPKDDIRIDTYGTVDELGAFVGLARQALLDSTGPSAEFLRLATALRRVQHQLFNLGAILATLPEDVHPKQPRVVTADATWLEQEMDRANAKLEPLRSFVLAGGHLASVHLHVCRTVCRRAERLATNLARTQAVDVDSLVYLNRLSDAFFVWSRFVNHLEGQPEELWQPNAAGEEIP
jgi:cob(I)alamin adenosyltransferase